MKTLILLAALALPSFAQAQDARSRHDIAFNAIRNVKAVVDTTRTTTQTITGTVGDPIPGCVGRVCGVNLSDPIPGLDGR